MNNQIAHDIEAKTRTEDVHIIENIDFTAMLLSDAVLQGLLANGFKKPSPIQLRAIPMGRCGYDLIIQAKSGTGKTAVFGIIALEMIEVTKHQVQVLILAPTREIAVQIKDVIQIIGMNLKDLKVEYFIGGTSVEEDIEKLKNCHIAVGAPGRVKHLIKDGHMKVDFVRLFVLDEADKLLEQSYQKSINYIYKQLKSTKQVIASSATYHGQLKKFLMNYMQTPAVIDPSQDLPVLLGIRQFVTIIKSHLNVLQQMTLKNEELIRILKNVSFNQCIVFCNYQNRADTLSNTLSRQGWPTTSISAAHSQKSRLEAVTSLKEFKCRILTTTDLTARGIDAANVDLVINYEIPYDSETYLHRMGRAGRYGSNGMCISIATEGAEVEKLQKILDTITSKLPVMKLPKENIPEDIWTCDVKQFEIIENKNEPEITCDTVKELSVKQEYVEEKNDDKKKLIESVVEDVKNEIKMEAGGNVELILENLKNEENMSKQSCKNTFNNMNPADIFKMLSAGTSTSITKEIKIEEMCVSMEKNVEEMLTKLNEKEKAEKNEIKNKLGKMDISSVLNLLTQDKETVTPTCDSKFMKSKRKKVKRNENKNKDGTENNEQFDNEAKLYQETNIVHKNISLYNIVKVVVEEDSITEESVTSTENLLKIMEQEDNLEIKQQKSKIPFTDLLNQVGLKPPEEEKQTSESNIEEKNESQLNEENLKSKQTGLSNWEVVNESEVSEEVPECKCAENLFTSVFDYAISKIDIHWKNSLCDYHKNLKIAEARNEEEIFADAEYEDEEYYDENKKYIENEEYYDENKEHIKNEEYYDGIEDYYDNEEYSSVEQIEENQEILKTEIISDEEIFVKAYEYALKSEVTECEETESEAMNCEDNEACGYAASYTYDHLNTSKRKRKRNRRKNSKPKVLPILPDGLDSNSTYESYFDYYDTMLAENGPYFTDVTEFEKWFKKWQESVSGVRNYIQEEVFANEKLVKENGNPQ